MNFAFNDLGAALNSNAVLVVPLALVVAIVCRFVRRPAVAWCLWGLVLLKFVTPAWFPVVSTSELSSRLQTLSIQAGLAESSNDWEGEAPAEPEQGSRTQSAARLRGSVALPINDESETSSSPETSVLPRDNNSFRDSREATDVTTWTTEPASALSADEFTIAAAAPFTSQDRLLLPWDAVDSEPPPPPLPIANDAVDEFPRSQAPAWERASEKLRYSTPAAVPKATAPLAKQSFAEVRSQTGFGNEVALWFFAAWSIGSLALLVLVAVRIRRFGKLLRLAEPASDELIAAARGLAAKLGVRRRCV